MVPISTSDFLTIREAADELAREASGDWRSRRNKPLDKLFRAVKAHALYEKLMTENMGIGDIAESEGVHQSPG